MDVLGPQEIRRILGVTDSLRIHRESVSVPLATRGEGSLRLTESSRVEIVAPATGDFDAWLEALPQKLASLDLARVRSSD
jgi:hypothetical protein